MKQMFTILLTVMAASAVAAQTTQVTPGEEVEIMKQMTQIASKFNAGDYKYLIDLMPASIFTISGADKQKLSRETEQAIMQLKESGVTIRIKNHGNIMAAHTCKGTKVVFIRTYMELDGPDSKVMSTGYMVASRESGPGSWYFADGAGMSSRAEFDQIYGCNGVNLTLPLIKNETIAKKKP